MVFIILSYIGFGFTALFIPKNLQRFLLLIAPLIGVMLITVLGSILSMGRIPMNIGSYVILGISTFFALYAFFSKKIVMPKRIYVLMFIIIGSIISFFPPVHFASPLSLSYAEFFKTHTVLDTYAFNKTFLQNNLHIGRASVISFFSVVLSKKNFAVKQGLISMDQYIFAGTAIFLVLLLREYILFFKKNKMSFFQPTEYDLFIAISLSSMVSIYPAGFKLIVFVMIVAAVMKNSLFYIFGRSILLTVLLNPVIIGLTFR